ncbi:MAG TPA: MFS transporter [Syntrophorhabdaceae bacterium]|nr:MFS transporter [Syntrophorhabdaceae bacterium]
MTESSNTDDSKAVVLAAVTLSSFLTPMALSSVTVALPTMAKDLGMSAILMSWVASAYLLAAAAFLVPLGRTADIVGRKKIFLIGTIIFTATSFILTFLNSTATIIALRAVQGLGGAMIFGTGVAILTSVFPASERGRAIGISVAAVYLGLSAGPFLGGILTEEIGWRSVFFINVPFGIAIFCFCVWKLHGEWADARGEAFDYVGSGIYCLVLIIIMYGFSVLPRLSAFLFILPGLIGIYLFMLWEKRVKSPVMNVSLFKKNRVFTLSNLAALINYSATYGVGFLLSLYLQQIKNFSPMKAGLILVSQPIVQALLSPMAGKLSDRKEPRILASAGMAIDALGLFLLAFISPSTPTSYILADLVILGIGFALFSSPNTNAVMGSVETKLYGVASSTLSTMRLLGQMFSMGVAMLLFSVYIGEAEIGPESLPALMTSERVAFITFGGLCLIGIYASLSRGDLHE